MRVIGLDVHRTFAEVVFLEEAVLRSGGRVELTAERLAAFGRGLLPTDEAVLEATGNAAAIVRALKPYVAQVVIANPLQVKAIAHACVFRLMPATDSAASRPPIPRDAGRVFRGMPATPCGRSDIRA